MAMQLLGMRSMGMPMADMDAGAVALQLWLRGVGLGLAIAAPVGPIGILCMRRTLARGWQLGLVSGLGAATADGLYGGVAALGLGALSALLVAQRSLLQAAGGLFLLYLAVQSWRQPGAIAAPAPGPNQPPPQTSPLPSESPRPRANGGGIAWGAYLGAYGSTLALTLTNPATILAFGAIFAGAGLGNLAGPSGNLRAEATGPELIAALSLIFGIFCGSASWWLLLCGLTQRLGRALGAQQLRWIGRGSGVALGSFGLAVLLHLVLGTGG